MTRFMRSHRFPALMVGLALWVLPSAGYGQAMQQKADSHGEHRDVLWHFIHDQCAPAASSDVYPPSPCIEVDASGIYAVFKDRNGRFQYLVLPLARISGIEDPQLQAPSAPNYLAYAWRARLYVEAALHQIRPRDELSLVVNSARGRSQDQLHIHVDCVRTDVHDTLQRLLPQIGKTWQPLSESLPPHQHRYQAMWVSGEALTVNPFKLLAASLQRGDQMALHSLVVVGARSPAGEPGFILLSGRVDPAVGDRGSGDELQDRDCAIATRPSP